ncbi:MAG: HAD-IIB family hydrolase [Acidobacteriota bacterium]
MTRCIDASMKGGAMSQRWVIFTDLDGTFLGVRDYDYTPLRPAVRALQRRRIPIVFCTSKTRAEVEELREDLGIRDPFIVENGGAVYVPKGCFRFPLEGAVARGAYVAIEQGLSYRTLVKALDTAEAETRCRIGRFGRLGPGEISRVTGLPRAKARLAKAREFDEPFWFVTESPSKQDAFLKELRRWPGLRVTRGNRFYHAKGVADKGRAVEILKAFYRRLWPRVRFAGLGDSLNDLPMLKSVDVPILIRGPDGGYDRSISVALPKARRAAAAAPLGWATVLPIVLPGVRLRLTDGLRSGGSECHDETR